MDGVSVGLLIEYGYLFVFAWVFAEQIGLPLPAEPVLLAAGALAGAGHVNIAALLIVAGLASLVSDVIWYGIGRIGGVRVLGWLCRITLEPDSCVRRTQQVFTHHGARSLLVAKFVPGFNTIAPPLAGIVRMPLAQFAVYTGIGGLIWAGAFMGLGWIFSEQLEQAAGYVARFGGWALAVLGVAFGAHVGWKLVKRQRFLRRIQIARITPDELKAQLDAGEDVIVVDLRDQLDFAAEPSIIPGALHLTTQELHARHHEIPRERDIVLYCT